MVTLFKKKHKWNTISSRESHDFVFKFCKTSYFNQQKLSNNIYISCKYIIYKKPTNTLNLQR